ncbi:MAG: ribonuclease P protein component [Leptolyngbyaceae cyanobacterium SM2_5_2]|nr:ribonuclease P protein component [Leptolyngbyaceae cyanobacterium SM2_5_2]
MLRKPYRLRSSREFSRVYQSGRKAVSPHLVVRVLEHPPEAQPEQAELWCWLSPHKHQRELELW